MRMSAYAPSSQCTRASATAKSARSPKVVSWPSASGCEAASMTTVLWLRVCRYQVLLRSIPYPGVPRSGDRG